MASDRYDNANEVVRAGLRSLEAEERAHAMLAFPPGALKHVYSPTENRAKRRTATTSTLKVEAE